MKTVLLSLLRVFQLQLEIANDQTLLSIDSNFQQGITTFFLNVICYYILYMHDYIGHAYCIKLGKFRNPEELKEEKNINCNLSKERPSLVKFPLFFL